MEVLIRCNSPAFGSYARPCAPPVETLAETGRYGWEAAGRGGVADDLDKAKKAVEAAVAMADKQLDLFGQ